MKHAVFVFAHPDDAEIACYGTIRKFIDRGIKVDLVILTNGVTGISVDDQIKHNLDALDSGLRKQETRDAFRDVAVDIHFLDLPAAELTFDSVAITRVEKYLKQLGGDTLVTHFNNDSGFDHQEHGITARIVLNISVRLKTVDTILLSEPIQSARMNFLPNYFVDISGYFDAKCAALDAHKSQSGRFYLSTEFHRDRCRRNALSANAYPGLFESYYLVKCIT